jgi:uncharacterized RDD family membrane protein YckC
MERQEPLGVVPLDVPEHGELHLPLAGIGRRSAAAIVDMTVLLAIAAFLLLAGGLSSALTNLDALIGPGMVAASFLLPAFGPLAFELLLGGQSPGKRLLDLRVISMDGVRASVGQLFLRNLVRLVDFLPFAYFVGLVATFASKRAQRLGDLVAGTLVIREDASALLELGLPPSVPHGHELAGIPETVLRAARLLLEPGRDLTPALREARRGEITGLVRRFRPDLAGESDEIIWARLRRAMRGEP